ncbi:hypothetical protein AVEN_242595-1 [Araneus ventricosus]|uniref:Uncharacterized protein n=1 Tax=Araneus ventricosus TaxID=182803 RepID=A0A4Y2ERP1_ARAVE|nr:hypothetical protein AVEN_242595-1 [Araneus ventricosus]
MLSGSAFLAPVYLPSWDRKESLLIVLEKCCGEARTWRDIGKYSDIKGSESANGDLSAVPTGYCISIKAQRKAEWPCSSPPSCPSTWPAQHSSATLSSPQLCVQAWRGGQKPVCSPPPLLAAASRAALREGRRSLAIPGWVGAVSKLMRICEVIAPLNDFLFSSKLRG